MPVVRRDPVLPGEEEQLFVFSRKGVEELTYPRFGRERIVFPADHEQRQIDLRELCGDIDLASPHPPASRGQPFVKLVRDLRGHGFHHVEQDARVQLRMDVVPVDGKGKESRAERLRDGGDGLQKGSDGSGGDHGEPEKQGRRGKCDVSESGGSAQRDAAGQMLAAENDVVGIQQHRSHRVAYPVHFVVAGGGANVRNRGGQVLVQIIVEADVPEVAAFRRRGALAAAQFDEPAVAAFRLECIDDGVAVGRLEIQAVGRKAVNQQHRFARRRGVSPPEQLDAPAVLREDGMNLVGPLRPGIAHHQRDHVAVHKKGEKDNQCNTPEDDREQQSHANPPWHTCRFGLLPNVP